MSSLASRLYARALVELNLLDWQASTAAFRAKSHPRPERTVLICALMTSIASSKAEAMFAAALREHGMRVVVLLPNRSSVIERIHRATGPTETLAYDEIATDDDRMAAAAEARAHVATSRNVHEIFAWEPDGFRIGRNALSLAARRLRIGRFELSNSAHRSVVEDCLAEALLGKRIASRIVAAEKPTLALFNERGYSPAGEVFDGCVLAGVDCVQWMGSPQSDALLYKRYSISTRDTHPFALGAETWAQIQAEPFTPDQEQRMLAHIAANYSDGGWFKRQQLQVGKPVFSVADTRRKLGVAEGRKVAVIFSHIFYDATFFYGSSLFADYEEWLIECVRCAIANPALDWVVKVHPVNVWRSKMDGKPMEQLEAQAIVREFGELPAHVRILPADSEINTYSLFGAIDYGLTVRGTIGMELPAFGIPVVTAGTGRYSGAGFTMDPASQQEFRALLARLHEMPRLDTATQRLARMYLWATFVRRPVPMQTFILDYEARKFNLAELHYDTEVALHSAGTGAFGDDLSRLGAWLAAGAPEDIMGAQA